MRRTEELFEELINDKTLHEVTMTSLIIAYDAVIQKFSKLDAKNDMNTLVPEDLKEIYKVIGMIMILKYAGMISIDDYDDAYRTLDRFIEKLEKRP